MGLDMYLEARKYVSKSNWKDGEPSPNPDYSSLVAIMLRAKSIQKALKEEREEETEYQNGV